MDFHHRDGAADELLNGLELVLLVDVAEGDGGAAPPGPAGAADAVDVGLRYVGQVVVEHVGELLNVQAPGGDVGGHQNLHRAALEVGQGLLSGGLALVAVDGGGGDTRLDQIPGHLVGPVLGAGKHQGVFHVQLPDEGGEQPGLVAAVHVVELLVDHLHRGGDGVDRHPGGVVQQGVHQPLHLGGHSGGEKEGLLLGGQPAKDAAHVVDEAHVQHPVGLVQHEDLQPGQVDELLAVEVAQAAGGGHQDVHAIFQPLHLGGLAHAAEDDGGAQGQVLAIGLKALLDLEGQLPGGGEDQGPDGAALGLMAAKLLENGGGEGAGLSGAGLGAAQHVPAGQRGGNGFCLDGRGLLVALVGQGPQDGLVEAEFLKGHVVRPLQRFGPSCAGGRLRVIPHRAEVGENAAKPAGKPAGISHAIFVLLKYTTNLEKYKWARLSPGPGRC